MIQNLNGGVLKEFYFKKFMQESNLKQIFHLDSDAVLLVDINDLIFNEECAYMIPNHQKILEWTHPFTLD